MRLFCKDRVDFLIILQFVKKTLAIFTMLCYYAYISYVSSDI